MVCGLPAKENNKEVHLCSGQLCLGSLSLLVDTASHTGRVHRETAEMSVPELTVQAVGLSVLTPPHMTLQKVGRWEILSDCMVTVM